MYFMKILFVKIANMKDYQGISVNDVPIDCGSYVNDTGNAFEKYNFKPRLCQDGVERCFGFFETKHRNGVVVGNEKDGRNKLNINKIEGCERLGNVDYVEDVLVVFCTKVRGTGTRVVGWYKHATVFRNCQKEIFDNEEQLYFMKTESKNAILLPYQTRGLLKWEVPSAIHKGGDGFGFGQSLHWFAEKKVGRDDLNANIRNFVNSLVEKINDIDGGI